MTDISIDDMITARTEARPDFKRGGQPLTPFRNKDNLKDLRFDEESYPEELDYQYDALDAIDAYRNKQDAMKVDAGIDKINQIENRYHRNQNEYAGDVAENEIGAQKPRSKIMATVPYDDGYYTPDGEFVYEESYADVDNTETPDKADLLTERAKSAAKEAAPLKETADKLREEKKIEEEREAKLEDILTPEILEGYRARTLPKELQDAIQSLYDNYAIVKSASAEFSKAEDSESTITEDAVAESAGAPCAEDAGPKHGKGIDALIAERQ